MSQQQRGVPDHGTSKTTGAGKVTGRVRRVKQLQPLSKEELASASPHNVINFRLHGGASSTPEEVVVADNPIVGSVQIITTPRGARHNTKKAQQGKIKRQRYVQCTVGCSHFSSPFI